jgi:UDP-N-acetylmuramate--alanine ligase
MPGRFNVLNATAAIAVGKLVGLEVPALVEPMAAFAGVARRFETVGSARNITVIDDFAHNPDKLAASLTAGRTWLAHAEPSASGRLLAVFQPHGFGPTKFLRAALVESLANHLKDTDVLWLPEIFYAGGTVSREISSRDLVEDLVGLGRNARFAPDRLDLPRVIAAEARDGDLILVMGARDPSLTELCRDILAELG